MIARNRLRLVLAFGSGILICILVLALTGSDSQNSTGLPEDSSEGSVIMGDIAAEAADLQRSPAEENEAVSDDMSIFVISSDTPTIDNDCEETLGKVDRQMDELLNSLQLEEEQ